MRGSFGSFEKEGKRGPGFGYEEFRGGRVFEGSWASRLLLTRLPKKVCTVAAISMSATVDMSLDDIIKKNRERGRGRGRASRGPGRFFNNGRMSGAVRRGPLSVNARPPKYSNAKASSKLWMVYAYDSEPSRTMKSKCKGSLLCSRN
ncbi:hypothetical protein SADUNF_Sadunf04G0060100 [Salix dunnii]|uniref:Uncharacterized protein n=1 Tax=Salix dunnii TaxID=1413687 RepID=A0A835K441_9ROSI|nr:hypothetical protein SADUNF_Sadunf04G0060100 [Salix dunnii]